MRPLYVETSERSILDAVLPKDLTIEPPKNIPLIYALAPSFLI